MVRILGRQGLQKKKPAVSFILLEAAKGWQVYARARLLLLSILPTGKPKQQQQKAIINKQKKSRLLEISSNPSQKSPTVAPVMISLVLQLTRSTSCWPNSFLKDSGLQRSAFSLWCTPDTITGYKEDNTLKNHWTPKPLIPTKIGWVIHITYWTSSKV